MAPGSPFKQKYRAIDDNTPQSDFVDLNPLITYRHLHSQHLGVKNPLRVIALCDSDAFYAACEQVRLAADPNVPLVVLQWDALIAVNYPARKFGITRMCKLKDALKMCPHLRVVHVATFKEGDSEPQYWDKPNSETDKVSLDYYRRESMKIINIFKETLPTGEIEKASIDEAFVDFSVPVRDILLERYPYLSQIPSSGPDTQLPPPPPVDWTNLGNLIPVDPTNEDSDDNSNTETDRDETAGPSSSSHNNAKKEEENQVTWHDVALSIAAELMDKIRNEVLTKLGYSMSAGIARNKFLAKLSASYKKPNNQTILRNAAIPNYLRPIEFQKIRFLGGKLGKSLAEEYDVSTVGDLLTISLEEMQSKFGEGSIWVYEVLRGIDRSEVKERTAINKSMAASKNLQKPIMKPSEGPHWIRVLAAELAFRLSELRDENPGLWPRTIVLHVRSNYSTSRSKQTSFPFSRNVSVDVVANAGNRLWKELVGTDTSFKGTMKVTNVSLAFTGVEMMENGQKGIEGFFNSSIPAGTAGGPGENSLLPLKSDEDANVKSKVDTPDRNVIGDRKRKRGSFFCSTSSSSSLFDDFNIDKNADMSDDVKIEDNIDFNSGVDIEGNGKGRDEDGWSSRRSKYSFTCERCGKTFAVQSTRVSQFGNGSSLKEVEEEEAFANMQNSEEELKKAYDSMRMEHDDYHFAQDLARQGSNTTNVDVDGRPGPAKKIKVKMKVNNGAGSVKDTGEEKKKVKGIARYFSRK